MATIPLYNDGQMPGVPEGRGLSLVPEARYRVDYAGLAEAAARANEQPPIPKEMFDGKGKMEAAEAWSGAVQQVGGVVKQLAGMALKAKDYADLHEGRGRIQDEASNLSQWRTANPDTTKWAPETDHRTKGLMKHFSSQSYSPQVAAQLQRDVDQFRDQSAIENDVGAMEVNLGRVRSAVDGKRSTAVDMGDLGKLAEATAEGAEMGFYTAEEAQVLYWEGQQRIFSKRRESVVADSPQQVLKHAESPEGKETPAEFAGLGEATWAQLKLKAQESLYSHQRGLMEAFREAVQSSTVRDDADAKAWAEMHVPEGMGDATLRPLMHRVLHSKGVDMVEVNRMRAAIGAHDPKGAKARVEQGRLRLLNMQFPAEIQEELDGMLDARVKSGKPEPLAMQLGRVLIQKLHRNQLLPDAEGRRWVYAKESGKAGEAAVIDEEARTKSALWARQLEDQLEAVVLRREDMTETEMQQWLAAWTLPAVWSRGAAAVLERIVMPKGLQDSPAPGGLLGRLQAALSKPEPSGSR